VAYNGYIYVIGGLAGALSGDCSTTAFYCNGVWYDTINSNGTIGANWTQDTTATFPSGMPPRARFGVVVYNGYLYVVGGNADTGASGDCSGTNNVCNGVWSAPINGGGGAVGAWSSTISFAAGMGPREFVGAVAYNGYLYAVGGVDATATGDCNNTSDYCNGVWYDTIGSGGIIGGTWTQDTTATFPSAMPPRDRDNVLAYNGYLYLLGGSAASAAGDCIFSSDACNGVWSAPINGGGSAVGAWSQTSSFTNMPARYLFGAIAYNGYLYVIGGDDGNSTAVGDCDSSNVCNGIFSAPINSGGTVGAWSQDGVGGTFPSSGPTMPGRYKLEAVAYNGYLYAVGGNSDSLTGDCNNTGDFCNGVFVAGLQSIPRVGDYSYLIDMTGSSSNDPTPIELLTNGGVCASGVCTTDTANPGLGGLSGPGGLIINYQFASNACATFNARAALADGVPPFGTPEKLPFTTDGCGNGTNVGRYMWVQYLLDDSPTASFPDQSGNHTSVTGFTLYYHPAPGFRLRGGATFSNGSLQTLDAPP